MIRPVSEWCFCLSGSTIFRLWIIPQFDSLDVRPSPSVEIVAYPTRMLERGPSNGRKGPLLSVRVTYLMAGKRGSSFHWFFLSRPSPLPWKSCRPRVVASGQEHNDPPREPSRFVSLSVGVTAPAARVESDDVGLSPVSVISLSAQVKPPSTLLSHTVITARRRVEEVEVPSQDFGQSWEPRPSGLAETRFPSELNFTWPLRHRPLLDDAGCVPPPPVGPRPRPFRVGKSSSEVFRTDADPPG